MMKTDRSSWKLGGHNPRGPQCLRISGQDAILQMQDSPGLSGEIGIMCNNDKARASIMIELEHQIEHFSRSSPVEIARGLIRKHTRRPGNKRTRHGSPLALTSRELARGVSQAML